MRIALYSPYFPKHIGGGEKYLLDTAQALSHYGEVSLAVNDQTLTQSAQRAIYKKYERFMGGNLESLKLISTPLGTGASLTEKFNWTKQFDLLYYITDGSFFFSGARRNVMHIQTPLPRAPLNFQERLKRLNWHFINTNSEFTKQVVEQHWKVKVNAVHHPMVDVVSLEKLASGAKKQPVVLHVGRFFQQLHSKRQDVLVKFFKDLLKQYPTETKGWQLVLVGSVEDEQYAAKVRKLAKGAPIKVIHQISRAQLDKWYAKAAIYWHATGFGLSEKEKPAHMEHFGISTVEAMAAGAVPVVIGQGGQPEVVGEQLAQLLWRDEETCLATTARLMSSQEERAEFARLAQIQAQHFGPAAFEENIRKMLQQLRLI